MSALVVNRTLKLFKVIKYSNRAKKVCRVYDPTDVTIPTSLLEESAEGSNVFEDKINHLRFKHTTEGMIAW